MKSFLLKCLIVSCIVVLFILGIGMYLSDKFTRLEYSINHISDNDNSVFYSAVDNYYMVSGGSNNLSVTPIDANIIGYILTLKLNLHNKTGNTLELKDFGTSDFGAYTVPCKIESENYVVANETDQEITVSFNVKGFRKISVIPTEITVHLGTYVNGNYTEYKLNNYISWS